MKRITWMGSTMAILALVAAQARANDAATPAAGAAVEQVKATDTDQAQAKPKKQWKRQTLCPVNGDPVDKEVYVDYKRWRIYFCCKACVPKFEADPDTYMKKMIQEGVRCERNKSAKKDHPAKAKAAGEAPKSE